MGTEQRGASQQFLAAVFFYVLGVVVRITTFRAAIRQILNYKFKDLPYGGRITTP